VSTDGKRTEDFGIVIIFVAKSVATRKYQDYLCSMGLGCHDCAGCLDINNLGGNQEIRGSLTLLADDAMIFV
jgi:hypothetical protein